MERTKGRIQFLERTTSTSLITVNLERVRQFKAAFKADRIQVEEGEEVFFTDQTVGGEAPFGYSWDFGDGATSTEKSPAHSYNSGGAYSVSLKVTDPKGNSSVEAKSNYIKVLFPPGWTPGKTARDAWNGLKLVSRGLGNLGLWVGIFVPIWGPAWFIFWYIRRRRRKAKAARGS
ncbi:MAG: PKD domain-containing protein [Chloroflexi bacterium]|nr:PKD domain-containing protein [Chloroflexota bacterium]